MKNRIYMLLCLGLVLALCAAYWIGAVWKPEWRFYLNVTKYHEAAVGDYELAFYGSGGKVRRVKIYKDGKRLAKADFFSAADFLLRDDFEPFVRSMENGDTALFIPNGRDADDLDLHTTLYIIDPEGRVTAYPEYDLANPRYEGGIFWSEQCYRADTASSEIHDPPYKLVTVRSAYETKEGRLCLTFEQSVIYYSETDIYCVATREWDGEANTLGASAERWLFPSKYKTELAKLQEAFMLPIPAYDVIPR